MIWGGNLLRFKGRMWVGNNSQVQQQILTTLHAGAIGGHSGVNATLQRIRQLFAWPQMKAYVQQFIDNCSICKQAKPERVKYPGLLKPLVVPDLAWQVVSLDFVEGLPRSSGYTTILVVVDKLTKYAHFLPLSTPTRHLRWCSCTLIRCSACTVCRRLLFLIGTRCSRANFGRHCSNCPRRSYG